MILEELPNFTAALLFPFLHGYNSHLRFMAAAISTSTASNCSSFFSLRSTPDGLPDSSSRTSSPPVCARSKIDGVAVWIMNRVSTAFFASLDRCFCIGIATEDDGDDANEMPLILSADWNFRRRGDGGSSSRRRSRKDRSVLVHQD